MAATSSRPDGDPVRAFLKHAPVEFRRWIKTAPGDAQQLVAMWCRGPKAVGDPVGVIAPGTAAIEEAGFDLDSLRKAALSTRPARAVAGDDDGSASASIDDDEPDAAAPNSTQAVLASMREAILDDPAVDRTAFRCWAYLAKAAENLDDGSQLQVVRSVTRMAGRLGHETKTVRAALVRLEQAGWVTRWKKNPHNRHENFHLAGTARAYAARSRAAGTHSARWVAIWRLDDPRSGRGGRGKTRRKASR
jgi:hypothetical protein